MFAKNREKSWHYTRVQDIPRGSSDLLPQFHGLWATRHRSQTNIFKSSVPLLLRTSSSWSTTWHVVRVSLLLNTAKSSPHPALSKIPRVVLPFICTNFVHSTSTLVRRLVLQMSEKTSDNDEDRPETRNKQSAKALQLTNKGKNGTEEGDNRAKETYVLLFNNLS